MSSERCTQAFVVGNPDGIPGDCLRAAIASLLARPLEAVPHFALFTWWEHALSSWAKGEGWEVERISVDQYPEERCVVAGMSCRGVQHAVVGAHGDIEWDPHPSRDGLDTITDAWIFRRPSWYAALAADDPARRSPEERHDEQ